jgi:hypothetical protein
LPSQPEDQVAYGGRLRHERVMPGVELHDVACPSGEVALALGGGMAALCGRDHR